MKQLVVAAPVFLVSVVVFSYIYKILPTQTLSFTAFGKSEAAGRKTSVSHGPKRSLVFFFGPS